jgi:hypothetical protein
MRVWKQYGLLLLLLSALNTAAQDLQFSDTGGPGLFPLIGGSQPVRLLTDSKDAKVVAISAAAFAGDYALLSNSSKLEISNQSDWKGNRIVLGTIGQSAFIDTLIRLRVINADSLRGQWERFSINAVKNPFSPGHQLLVIAGSDRRGTAFGIFHLSRMLGVSPFVWWADVIPERKKSIWISGSYLSGKPSVKFRGIFINDEDWGLQPWAARHMDTVIKDIGPRTYAKVFELLLRLKANYIWPAMHPCTKAFYYYKENPKVADDYAIIVGGSHCEPMLRNNVFEWAENFQEEYGKKPGEWRYDLNKDEIYTYWDDRIKESVPYESVFTIGMRGVHDGSMPGPKDPALKLSLLEQVIQDQRKILTDRFSKSAIDIPQIFVPYKEVLSLYRRGMKLDEDITIIWPDDNHGYIRQLPDENERQRSGGHGVYYHLSYWGSPHDYLWLSTISPALIGWEMNKAYQHGANRLWVFNVGDIKPAEPELQYAMDMAWDIRLSSPVQAFLYTHNWAKEIFGAKLAPLIAEIRNQYYLLAASAKPEHLGMVLFTEQQRIEREKIAAGLLVSLDNIRLKIPERLKDAWFQLMEYPVNGAVLMQEKIFSLRDRQTAKAFNAMAQIRQLTRRYNETIAAGKWSGIMSDHPRDMAIFSIPVHPDSLKLIRDTLNNNNPVVVINAADWSIKQSPKDALLTRYHGLGINGIGVGLELLRKGVTDFSDGYTTYYTTLEAGKYRLRVKCLPTFAIANGQLRFSVKINQGEVTERNVHTEAETARWKQNVVNGFSYAGIDFDIKDKEGCSIELRWLDPGLIINSLEIYHIGNNL